MRELFDYGVILENGTCADGVLPDSPLLRGVNTLDTKKDEEQDEVVRDIIADNRTSGSADVRDEPTNLSDH